MEANLIARSKPRSGLPRRALLGGLTGALLSWPRRSPSAMLPVSIIEVSAAPGASTGILRFANFHMSCSLGWSGIRENKREGDGASPEGTFALRELRYRADRIPPPSTGLAVHQTRPDDGWCDSPSDANYNRLVKLPYRASTERLWRADHLYDALLVVGYNDSPVTPGAGSAIFLHLAAEVNGKLQPTAGCVALRYPDFLTVAAACTPETRVHIFAA